MPNTSGTGLVIRPMGQMVQALSRYSSQLFQPPKDNIRDITTDAWFSPLQPVKPMAPDGTEPRGFQYWAGQNLIWTPRSDAEYTAADLKQLATYPLARICIENVKDAVSRTPWEIQAKPKPGETKKEVALRSKEDTNISKLTDLFSRPDREHMWDEWVRPLLDDMLVIDAATVLIRKTFNGDVVELPVIRGDSITRYIDVNGFTPLPPEPAYAQNWWGIPLVNLTTDQLMYKPRNIVPRNTVSSQLYGMSPTEQLAPEIQVGIKRLEFTLAYYTEGSIPGVVQVVPKGVPPDKIAEAMQWMNSDLAGDLAARRQWRMVQGFQEDGKPDQIEFTKEPLLADAFDELHIRKVCFGYGTSPQRLMKMMNRASAQQADESADVDGTLAWLKWLKTFIDSLIYKMGLSGYELIFNAAKEPDPEKQAAALKALTGPVLTSNESRKQVGEEPRSEPEADMLGSWTATGFIPIGMAAAQAGSETDDSGKTTVKETTDGNADDKSTAANGKDSKTNRGLDESGGKGADSSSKDGKDGGSNDTSKSVRYSHCSNHSSYCSGCGDCAVATIAKTQADKKQDPKIQRLRKLQRKKRLIIRHVPLAASRNAQRTIQRVLNNVLKSQNNKATQELQKLIKTSPAELRKISEAEKTKTLNRIFSSIDSEDDSIPGDIEEALIEAAAAGVRNGAMQVSITDKGMLSSINKTAKEWAHDRAAELVGMKWDDGELIDNPDARWAISETTREKIKSVVTDVFSKEQPTMDDIRKQIEETGIFSDTRASMIARSEISRAQGIGNLESWKASGLVETLDWVVSSDHDHDDDCDENEGDSPYGMDEVPDYPAHPNCDCVLVARDLAGDDEEE